MEKHIEITYGKHGWFWKDHSGKWGVVITSHILLNKHFNNSSVYIYPPLSEDVRYMDDEEFNSRKIVRLLQVNRKQQSELKEMHDKKHVRQPKSALITSGNNKEILVQNSLLATLPLGK